MMGHFIAFAFYLCVSAMILVIVPVMMHPTLPMHRKALIFGITFLVLVPGSLALYTYFGVPSMAVSGTAQHTNLQN